MSRFSKIPVQIPEAVQVNLAEDTIKVVGPKGSLEKKYPRLITIEKKDNEILVKSKEKVATKFGKSIVGTIRSHIINMIKGVTVGWNKKLEINGTGYRAEVRGNDLVLTVGYSHPVIISAPKDVKFTVEKNVITVDGIDKEIVGQLAASIKAVRQPDPYKGKGIRYFGEVLKLKPGKQAAKAGGAA